MPLARPGQPGTHAHPLPDDVARGVLCADQWHESWRWNGSWRLTSRPPQMPSLRPPDSAHLSSDFTFAGTQAQLFLSEVLYGTPAKVGSPQTRQSAGASVPCSPPLKERTGCSVLAPPSPHSSVGDSKLLLNNSIVQHVIFFQGSIWPQDPG